MAQQVTWNLDSNYVLKKGGKNGSLTFCSRIWLWNILPISRDQSTESEILGKTHVSGELFTGLIPSENMLKSDLCGLESTHGFRV